MIELLACFLQTGVFKNKVLDNDRPRSGFEAARRRICEIAQLLDVKSAVPAVAEQLSYLASIQDNEFWEGIDLIELEDLRERLRYRLREFCVS